MKRVSPEVAKYIKDAGYKFTHAPSSFFTNNTNSWYDEDDGELYTLPYVMEVWLWLWQHKKIIIPVDGIYFSQEACASVIESGGINCLYITPEHNNPEDAITEAINYIVENNLVK